MAEKGPTVFPGQIRAVITHRKEPVVKSTGASVSTRAILSESGADTSLSLVTDACLRRSDPAVRNCF